MHTKNLSLPLVLVMAAALVLVLFPVFWIVMTAIKPPTDWNASPAIWVPSHPTLINFRTLFDPDAIREYGVGGVSQSATKAVFGSIFASVIATVLSVLVGLFSAIGISRYGNGSRVTPLIILSGRMFPPAAIAVPFVTIFSNVGLTDSYAGLIAIYVAVTLQISHILKRLPKTMSGGERQRIALGRALIRTPNLFLLDEPLSSLDAMLRIELRAELKRLQRDLGYSFLLATPDYNEALAIADSVVVLREGRVVQIARPQTLYDEPFDRDVARVVGSPQINLIEARYVPNEDGGDIEVAQGRLPVPSHLHRTLASRDGPFELGIRPENLRLTNPAHAPISAMLIDIEPLGLKSVLTVRSPGAELRLLVESILTSNILLGESVGVEPINDSMLLAFDPSTGKRISPLLN